MGSGADFADNVRSIQVFAIYAVFIQKRYVGKQQPRQDSGFCIRNTCM